MSNFDYPIIHARLRLLRPDGSKRTLDLSGTLDPEHMLAMITNVSRDEYAKPVQYPKAIDHGK